MKGELLLVFFGIIFSFSYFNVWLSGRTNKGNDSTCEFKGQVKVRSNEGLVFWSHIQCVNNNNFYFQAARSPVLSVTMLILKTR